MTAFGRVYRPGRHTIKILFQNKWPEDNDVIMTMGKHYFDDMFFYVKGCLTFAHDFLMHVLWHVHPMFVLIMK